MNSPIYFSRDLSTADVLEKLRKTLRGERDGRVWLDGSGRSVRPPFANFNDLVTQHARSKRRAEAEGLYIADKMTRLELVGPQMEVQRTGAVLQTFGGVNVDGRRDLDMQACHTMPFQTLFDRTLPYFLRPPEGMQLTHRFQHRNMLLYARCDWQPRAVNDVDSGLEGPSGFVEGLYLTALRLVMAGHKADDVYPAYSAEKGEALWKLRDVMNSDAFSASIPMRPKRGDTRQTVEAIRDQIEATIEIYAAQERIPPMKIAASELKLSIESETWLIPVQNVVRPLR